MNENIKKGTSRSFFVKTMKYFRIVVKSFKKDKTIITNKSGLDIGCLNLIEYGIVNLIERFLAP